MNICNNIYLNFNVSIINKYTIYQFISNNKDLINLHKEIKSKFKKYIQYPKNNNNYFYENTSYTNIFDLVKDHSKKKFIPHITIGIIDKNLDKNIDKNIDNLEIKCNEIEINIFKIGDFGTACPINNIFYYCHRINNSNELKDIPNYYGIELDLRDKNQELILAHDPFSEGTIFSDYLKNYDKSSIILNIKSERIEFKVLEELKKYNINNYFFLDCSFPIIYQLNKLGEKNIAIRFSEYESIESVLLVKDMVSWVWIDCFNKFPLTKDIYNKIKKVNLKICLVSPELQGHDNSLINNFKEIIKKNNFIIDAICTKFYNIDFWKL